MAFRAVAKITWQQTVIDAILAALSARPAGPLTAGLNAHFYVAPHDANPVSDTYATLNAIEAAYTGYGPVALVLSAVQNTSQRLGRCQQADCDSICTGAGGGFPQIYGVFVTDTANSLLYGQGALDVPIPIGAIGDAANVDVILPFDFAQSA